MSQENKTDNTEVTMAEVTDKENLLSESALSASVNNALDSQQKPIDLTSFFAFLKVNLDDPIYGTLNLDQPTLERMKNHMISMKHGTYASVPIICGGPEKCPIFSHCWFTQRDPATGLPDPASSTYPVLAPCPVESSLIKMKIQQYAQEHLQSGFSDMDANSGGPIEISPSTMALLSKLAEIDIYEIRCNHLLAKGDKHGGGMNLMADTVEAIHDGTGDIIWGLKEHPILAVKEKLYNQKERIMKQLISTPEAKANMQIRLKTQSSQTNLAKEMLKISKSVSVHPDFDEYED